MVIVDWSLVWMCVYIFFCRIADVSLGTIRSVLTIKEKTFPAAIIGFFEVLIWFLVAREALTIDAGLLAGISYAAGFAAGTYVGGHISRRFIKGNVIVQIVTEKDDDMISAIRKAGYGVSVVNVNGSEYGDDKYMLFCDIDKARLPELKKLVHEHDHDAFIMVQETKQVYNGFIK